MASEIAVKRRRASLTAKFLRLITLGSAEQNFLGQPAIPWLLAITPKSYRRPLALRILAVSPHYFILQHSDLYPESMSRTAILEAEWSRMLHSRRQIYEGILKPYLDRTKTVLDFGCGPGALALLAAGQSKKVIGVDVSRGAIACAKVVAPSENLTFVTINGKDLSTIPDGSIDLLYSFAVIQHLSDEQARVFFREFHRVLAPGATALCHVARGENAAREEPASADAGSTSVIAKRLKLRMMHRSPAAAASMIADAGFPGADLKPVHAVAEIDDDLRDDYLAILKKSARA